MNQAYMIAMPRPARFISQHSKMRRTNPNVKHQLRDVASDHWGWRNCPASAPLGMGGGRDVGESSLWSDAVPSLSSASAPPFTPEIHIPSSSIRSRDTFTYHICKISPQSLQPRLAVWSVACRPLVQRSLPPDHQYQHQPLS